MFEVAVGGGTGAAATGAAADTAPTTNARKHGSNRQRRLRRLTALPICARVASIERLEQSLYELAQYER
jgi:hypothetical protein